MNDSNVNPDTFEKIFVLSTTYVGSGHIHENKLNNHNNNHNDVSNILGSTLFDLQQQQNNFLRLSKASEIYFQSVTF